MPYLLGPYEYCVGERAFLIVDAKRGRKHRYTAAGTYRCHRNAAGLNRGGPKEKRRAMKRYTRPNPGCLRFKTTRKHARNGTSMLSRKRSLCFRTWDPSICIAPIDGSRLIRAHVRCLTKVAGDQGKGRSSRQTPLGVRADRPVMSSPSG